MQEQMKAAFLHGREDIRLQEIPIPEPESDEVLVKVAANGICGSDVHFYLDGKLGPFVVDQPYIPGHEASGSVTKVGIAVKNCVPGDRVVIEPGISCRRCDLCKAGRYNLCNCVVFLSAPPNNGTFTEYVSIPWDFVFKIPDSISFEEAALIEPTAVGVHAADRGQVKAGMSVTVLGLGPIGLITLQCAKANGATEIIGVDIDEHRLSIASKLGATILINAEEQDVMEAIKNRTRNHGTDIVFETAGRVTTAKQAVHLARRGGVVVQVGWPEENLIPYDIATVIEKELDIRGINRYANAYPKAIQLVASNRIDLKTLITHRFQLTEIQKAFKLVSKKESGIIKAVVFCD